MSPAKQQQHLDNIKREVAVLRKLRGTLNVVHLQDVYEDATHVHIVGAPSPPPPPPPPPSLAPP